MKDFKLVFKLLEIILKQITSFMMSHQQILTSADTKNHEMIYIGTWSGTDNKGATSFI